MPRGGLNYCFFRRYIDDLFFIWVGTEESLKNFMNFLNYNPNNIKLDYHYSKEQVNYLDVTVLIDSGNIITKVYFKASDQNSYLSVHSGHHPTWLQIIPKGQFTRVCRNCTFDSDFHAQSEVLKNRFIEKGYQAEILDSTIRIRSGTSFTGYVP